MSGVRRYPIPASTHRVEQTIERSRFVATIGHAASVEEARAFVASVAGEFGDATHNCWAHVVGPPGDTSRAGLSDAGEPHGTAGRPMLTVLLGSGVGDIVAVVTRYFGGVKLGKGGLARAYSGSVKLTLEGLPLSEQIATAELRVAATYADAEPIKRMLPDFDAEVASEEYGTEVTMVLRLPEEHIGSLTEALAGVTNGRARVEPGG